MSKIIIIPIYKAIPDQTELVSFLNNIRVLSNHQISIVSHKNVDLSYYIDLLLVENINYQIDLFNERYFKNLASYNRLLLSMDFYQRYKNFNFMLITQLDVYVFRDELDFWCHKNYDYIGAPWFSYFRKDHFSGKLAKVGNGGFSLRNIQAHIETLEYAKNNNKTISIFNFINKYDLIECKGFTLKNILKKLLGINNNFQFYINSATNEDAVWALVVPEVLKKFKVAPLSDAIKFSFETDPSYLFKMNNEQLPFGCHAWQKYQYDEFWSNYIKMDT